MQGKKAIVIGGGIAGLCVALELSRFNIEVELIEKADQLGGHAGRLTCKAADRCVRCGACLVEGRVKAVVDNPKIKVHLTSEVKEVQKRNRFSVIISDARGTTFSCEADAAIIASGFSIFNPGTKPYGFGRFADVVTSLDLETMLKNQGYVIRPSDHRAPEKMAFIQCVGSRDEKAGHLWCSKVCCGSALRMSNLIKSRQPEISITIFFIDIQTFGRDFAGFYKKVQDDVRFLRSIPADVMMTEDVGLQITHFESASRESKEESFDLIVLSAGICPGQDLKMLADMFGAGLAETGFIKAFDKIADHMQHGVFAAGTALGPMGIEESIASAGKATWNVVRYLEI